MSPRVFLLILLTCLLVAPASGDDLDDARALIARGALDEAEQYLQRAVTQTHLAPEAYHAWASLQDRRGNATAAVELRCRACEMAVDRADWWLELGLSLQDLGRTDEAVAAYGRALTVDPRFARARAALATTYAARGDAETAEAEFRLALRAAPDLDSARQSLCRLLLGQGRVYDALALVQEGLTTRTKAPVLLGCLGSVYEALGETGRAMAAYEAQARAAPKDPAAWLSLGRMALTRRDTPRAISAYRKAAGMPRAPAAAHIGLAWALSERKSSLPQALRAAEQALKLEPTNTGAQAARAWVQVLQGAAPQGLATLESLAEFAQPSADALYCLGILSRDAGRREAALGYLRRAAALRPTEGLALRAQEDLSRLDAAPLTTTTPPPSP